MLSLRSGKSIICDETVSGMGNFLFVSQDDSEDFDDIFDAFLYSNKLFVIKNPNLWTVTKIKIDVTNNKVSINSYDSSISSVFEKLSEKTGKSIIFETLPLQKTSFHLQNQTVYDAVKIILQPYSEYSVTETATGVQISKKKSQNQNINVTAAEESICNISYSNNNYSVIIQNTKISDVLTKLFIYSEESYSNFLQNDEIVKNITFTDKSFEDSLMFILEQVNAEAVFSDGIWYLFIKQNRSNKQSVLERQKQWQPINLNNFNVSKIIPLITTKYQGLQIIEISSSKLAVYVTQEEYNDIKNYISRFDDEVAIESVNLRYIQTADLFASLPPSFSKDEIIDTGTGHSVFFIGTKEKRKIFLEQLKEIDKPKKLVRYDLLILQYEKTSNLSWGISTSIRPTEIGDRTLVSGSIGNLLNINFDAITAFGLTFSEKINTALANNQASVFADTTLYGLSGEKITFKNTNTYRYRDVTVDPTTGKDVYSTVTREITSGLVLEIDGWVSGDDIITMSVNTSVSKQGVDVSNTTGNPPATTEKNITTKIRAKNGEPVILSGLSQENLSDTSQGVPYVSKIPYAGNLFKNRTNTSEKTEMTIYLVPHIEESPAEESNESWKKILLDYLSSLEDKTIE